MKCKNIYCTSFMSIFITKVKTFIVYHFCHTTDETAEGQQQRCHPSTKCRSLRNFITNFMNKLYIQKICPKCPKGLSEMS